MMFHPCFTAPPGTNIYSARFQLFLVEVAPGVEVPASASASFDLFWTSVPDGRPALQIGQKLVIDWPAGSGNYVLEAADSLPASSWTLVASTPVIVNARLSVILEAPAAAKFYRLRAQP